jgi:hypothetical protein
MIQLTIRQSNTMADGFLETLQRIVPRIRNGMVNAANYLLLRSVIQVPVDTSALSRSGQTSVHYGNELDPGEVHTGFGPYRLNFPTFISRGKTKPKLARSQGGFAGQYPWLYAKMVHNRSESGGYLLNALLEGREGMAAAVLQGIHLGQVETTTTLDIESGQTEAAHAPTRAAGYDVNIHGDVAVPEGGEETRGMMRYSTGGGRRRASTIGKEKWEEGYR